MSEWLAQTLQQSLSGGSAWAYAAIFLGGVIASFSPCTYPALPLTVGYLGAQAQQSRARAFALSLALVAGLALVYAIAGVILLIIGRPLGTLAGNGPLLAGIGLIFVIMSLALLDVFILPTPGFLRRAGDAAGHRQGLIGAFLVGCASGLMIGPCTGPILGIAAVFTLASLQQAEGYLNYAAQAIHGGLMLFIFGLGQGALILIAGTFAGFLSRLPRSGEWLLKVKKAFALLILLASCLLFLHVGNTTGFDPLGDFLRYISR
ncbi:MAG: hypothetical protein N3A66_06830 [Planctomycetota bacterium]|nr:hypothetical protein [Planctomycetota bacterium]